MEECDCFPCGEKCLEEFEVGMYSECEGKCQSVEIPCQEICMKNTRQCGGFCLNEDMKEDFYECSVGDSVVCQSVTEPCAGDCPAGLVPCDQGTVCVSPDSPQYRNCSGSCLSPDQACEGECGEDRRLCGTECVLTNSTLTSCGDLCQEASTPCHGSCSLGYSLCNSTCLPDTGDHWTCDGDCVSTSTPCHSSCPTGRLLEAGQCVSPSDLCPADRQCLQDSDCQEGASCLLLGERFYCQCGLGYRLEEAGENCF